MVHERTDLLEVVQSKMYDYAQYFGDGQVKRSWQFRLYYRNTKSRDYSKAQ